MKRFIVCSILFAVLLAVSGIPTLAQDIAKLKYPPARQPEIPKVDRVTLDNGMRLYLLADQSLPILHISVRINGGSFLEPADKIGLADICGTVMRTGGTSKWTGDQIDEMLEAVGGSVETGIGLASGSAGVNVLSDYTDLGLQVLSEVLRHPVFNQDKIDLAKVEARSGISRRNDDADGIGRREFTKLIYGANSVYAREPEYKTINSIKRDDLIAFHAALFHPENVQMAIWGDFDNAQLLDKIKQYFGDWEKGKMTIPPLPKVDYKFTSRTYYIEKTDINQSKVFIGHIGGLVSDPDYAARIVMNNVLGGSFGSRLFNAVRTREGLAYTATGSYTSNISYPGTFYSYAATKSESTVKAIREIINQISRMRTDPPTPGEMSVGKDSYLNSFVFNFDSRAQIVNRLMNYDFFGLPEDFLQKERDQVEKVTPSDVVAAAVKNLHPDSVIVLVVGKGSDFVEGLDKLARGKVDTIDITIPSGEEKPELAVTPENLAKGQELIAKAVAAHGGMANFKKVKSITTKGTMTISTPQGDFALGVESIEVFPDKTKQTVSVMGRTMATARNGATGWKTDPRTGQTVDMAADDIAEAAKDMSRSPVYILMTSDKPANRLVYAGPSEINGTKVEGVAVVDADDKPICTLSLDAQSSRLVAISYWGGTMMGEGTVQEVYADFKTVNGLSLPMGGSTTLNGQKLGASTYSSYVINAPIPTGSFDKPK